MGIIYLCVLPSILNLVSSWFGGYKQMSIIFVVWQYYICIYWYSEAGKYWLIWKNKWKNNLELTKKEIGEILKIIGVNKILIQGRMNSLKNYMRSSMTIWQWIIMLIQREKHPENQRQRLENHQYQKLDQRRTSRWGWTKNGLIIRTWLRRSFDATTWNLRHWVDESTEAESKDILEKSEGRKKATIPRRKASFGCKTSKGAMLEVVISSK